MVLGFCVCFAFFFSAKFALAVSPTSAQRVHGEQAVGGSSICVKSKDVQAVACSGPSTLGFSFGRGCIFPKTERMGTCPRE